MEGWKGRKVMKEGLWPAILLVDILLASIILPSFLLYTGNKGRKVGRKERPRTLWLKEGQKEERKGMKGGHEGSDGRKWRTGDGRMDRWIDGNERKGKGRKGR